MGHATSRPAAAQAPVARRARTPPGQAALARAWAASANRGSARAATSAQGGGAPSPPAARPRPK
eukprot:327289-Lingulodinium_polyedra.AAC.1